MNLFESMRVYVQIVEGGSLSAAATHCGISPAMCGHHLRGLEQRLGVQLLKRTTRRQQPTEFGRDYYARCKEVLRLVGEAEAQALHLQSTPAGNLRVTAPVTFGSEALTPVVAEYLQRYPEVNLDLVLSDRAADLVHEGFDVAIRIGELADSSLIAQPLAPYRLMLCASPEYLARKGTPRTPDELVGHECLSFGPAGLTHWRMAQAGEEHRVPIAGRLKANSGQALRRAALEGCGIVLQPAVLLEPDVRAGSLVQLLPECELPARPMHLVYLRDRYRAPKVRTFVDFVSARFAAPRTPRAGPPLTGRRTSSRSPGPSRPA